jgi:hypothetical protein
MQQTKGLQRKAQLKKELQQLKINLVKKEISFNRFCEQNNILRQSAEKAFNGQWNGEKAQQLRQRLMEASRSRK